MLGGDRPLVRLVDDHTIYGTFMLVRLVAAASFYGCHTPCTKLYDMSNNATTCRHQYSKTNIRTPHSHTSWPCTLCPLLHKCSCGLK